MSLTTAQKHDLIIQFNNHRDETFDAHLTSKHERVEQEEKAGTQKTWKGGNSEYSKLYKKLGPDNKNKDVRKQLQEEVDMYTDN